MELEIIARDVGKERERERAGVGFSSGFSGVSARSLRVMTPASKFTRDRDHIMHRLACARCWCGDATVSGRG